jgi:hypothetical protein
MSDDELRVLTRTVLGLVKSGNLAEAKSRLEGLDGKSFTEHGTGQALALRGIVFMLERAKGSLDLEKLKRSLVAFEKSPWSDEVDAGYLEVMLTYLKEAEPK